MLHHGAPDFGEGGAFENPKRQRGGGATDAEFAVVVFVEADIQHLARLGEDGFARRRHPQRTLDIINRKRRIDDAPRFERVRLDMAEPMPEPMPSVGEGEGGGLGLGESGGVGGHKKCEKVMISFTIFNKCQVPQ